MAPKPSVQRGHLTVEADTEEGTVKVDSQELDFGDMPFPVADGYGSVCVECMGKTRLRINREPSASSRCFNLCA